MSGYRPIRPILEEKPRIITPYTRPFLESEEAKKERLARIENLRKMYPQHGPLFLRDFREQPRNLVYSPMKRERIQPKLKVEREVIKPQPKVEREVLKPQPKKKIRASQSIFGEIELDEEEILKNRTCNDPITLENQDEDSRTFATDENEDHLLLIGKVDENYYIDCAYRSQIRNILNNAQYRCNEIGVNYYTLTTSFNPYLRISEKELNDILNTAYPIYYLIPSGRRCGNDEIFRVNICGGEDCLEKIFKMD